MIKLTQFHPYWDLPNASPFCLKLETYLRMADVPFEVQPTFNPRISPTGKLPFIKDGDKIIPDSGIIIDYLKEKYGDPLDQHLTPEQKAHARSMQRLIEEHLYWTLVYSRWIDPKGWAIVKPAFFGKMPLPFRLWIPEKLRKKVERDLRAHGVGRHAPETIYQLGKDDVKTIADFLGKKKFMFGDKPTSLDACVYGIIANILYSPIESPLKEYTSQFDHLKQLCDRIKAAYYSS